ncbi:uncharacterized protein A4U43_C01F30680 [Asparagus officinalis]|uniref:Uncharacterized protein n=1 Tax=Asparagus officinalis TaxID=4686 RepID=A0A5P1FU10_ASPOF|nr:uncharacterized protein A4U43_C01F30680 [Asparagus officinalis]
MKSCSNNKNPNGAWRARQRPAGVGGSDGELGAPIRSSARAATTIPEVCRISGPPAVSGEVGDSRSLSESERPAGTVTVSSELLFGAQWGRRWRFPKEAISGPRAASGGDYYGPDGEGERQV